MPGTAKRYYLLDGIRGFAVVNMVVFHFLYDVFMIYGRDPNWYGQTAVRLWQQSICWTFILISGFVWSWGKTGNLKRGCILNLWGFLISLVTLLVTPQEAVWFGILNFIGCAILLLAMFEKGIEKIPPVLGTAVSFFLFLLCRRIQYGTIGLGEYVIAEVPDFLYGIAILTPFGFPFPDFRSSDYFPVLPWIFLYLCGFFLSKILMEKSWWKRIAQYKVPVLSGLGRKAIWVYLIHQPVCMLLCGIFFS